MRLRDGLVAARSHLAFIVVLCILFGVLQKLDRADGIDSIPENVTPEYLSPDRL